MSALTRFFSPKKTTQPATMVRSNVWSQLTTWIGSAFNQTSAGETVISRKSLAVNAVYVSGKIIGETASTLSLKTFQKIDGVRMEVPTQPGFLMGTATDPSNGITASDFWKAVGIHIVTHGVSYSEIVRDPKGVPSKIILIEPWTVEPYIDRSGSVSYKLRDSDRIYFPDDLLIFKNVSWDGVVGINPISVQKEVIGLAIKQQKFAGNSYGTAPNGYLSSEKSLGKEQLKDISDFWGDQSNANGVGGRGNTPVLGFGMKFHQSTRTPADLEYIDSTNLTADQIFANYRIPPPMRGDYSRATFANAEQAELVFMKHTMLPYLVAWEQELNLKLFPVSNRSTKNPMFFKFNVNSILRADFETRTKGYAMLLQNGVVSSNEVRALEDMNPKPEGGDVYYVPLNMWPENEPRPEKNTNNER